MFQIVKMKKCVIDQFNALFILFLCSWFCYACRIRIFRDWNRGPVVRVDVGFEKEYELRKKISCIPMPMWGVWRGAVGKTRKRLRIGAGGCRLLTYFVLFAGWNIIKKRLLARGSSAMWSWVTKSLRSDNCIFWNSLWCSRWSLVPVAGGFIASYVTWSASSPPPALGYNSETKRLDLNSKYFLPCASSWVAAVCLWLSGQSGFVYSIPLISERFDAFLKTFLWPAVPGLFLLSHLLPREWC